MRAIFILFLLLLVAGFFWWLNEDERGPDLVDPVAQEAFEESANSGTAGPRRGTTKTIETDEPALAVIESEQPPSDVDIALDQPVFRVRCVDEARKPVVDARLRLLR